MARNPLYAIIWLAILFFLAWPIAAACCGVRQLSKSPAFYLQIGCDAARHTSAGLLAGRLRSVSALFLTSFLTPFPDKYFDHLSPFWWLFYSGVAGPSGTSARVIYTTKYSIILFVPQRNLLSPLPQSHSNHASVASGT